MNNKKLLLKKIAWLESLIDHYETEFTRFNELLVSLGFTEGMETLKIAALELLNEQRSY